MELRNVLLFTILSSSLAVAGCNNRIVNEANAVGEKNSEMAAKAEQEKEQKVESQREIYKEMEKPIDEVIDKIDKDKKKVVDPKVIEKATYTNPEEFSKKLGQILYEFSTGELSVDDYYNFLTRNASDDFLSQYLPNESAGTLFLENVQSLLIDKLPELKKGYTISELTYDRFEKEAYFYRKVTTVKDDKPIYYISTIVKEGDSWKFQDDSPSPPFEQENDLED